MKIGLILPGNIWFCPYVNIYTQILDKENVDYDLISWNRDGTDKIIGYQYEKRIDNLSNPIIKLISLFFYIKFIKMSRIILIHYAPDTRLRIGGIFF